MNRTKRWMGTAAILLATAVPACGPSMHDVIVRDATVAHNTAALSLEAAQSTAELLYRAEQVLVMERAAKEPGATKESVRGAVERARADWKPVKEAFEKARTAQAALAQAIKAGQDMTRIGAALGELIAQQNAIASALNAARTRIGVTP